MRRGNRGHKLWEDWGYRINLERGDWEEINREGVGWEDGRTN